LGKAYTYLRCDMEPSSFVPWDTRSDSSEDLPDLGLWDDEEGEYDEGAVASIPIHASTGPLLVDQPELDGEGPLESASLLRPHEGRLLGGMPQADCKGMMSSFCLALDYCSVHAVVPRPHSLTPVGGSVRGVNYFGLALWGIATCFLFQEIYCELADHYCDRSGHGPSVGLSFGGMLYFIISGTGLFLLLLQTCFSPDPLESNQQLADLLNDATHGPENTLAIVLFLCLPALQAGVAGWVWEQSAVCGESAVFHVSQGHPASVLLLVCPFLWPLNLLALLLLQFLGKKWYHVLA